MISGEFGAFLQENPRLFTQLTDLYDSIYHGEKGDVWEKTLSTQDKRKLKEINLTGLFAANETHFNEALPEHAKTGGFLGRVNCVYESKRRKLDDALGYEGDDDEIDYDGLLKHLKILTTISGELFLTKEALQAYRDWYYPFYKSEIKDKTGTAARAKDSILKIAILISLSEDVELIITEDQIIEAIVEIMKSLSSTQTMILGEGKAEKAREAKIILHLLGNAKDNKMTRSKLLVDGFGNFDANDLDRVTYTFEQGKLIKIHTSGKDIIYTLTEKAINLLTKFNREEEK